MLKESMANYKSLVEESVKAMLLHVDFTEKRRQKSISEVEELITQHGKFHGGLVVDNPQWIGHVLSTTSLPVEAVKACVEEIWQCLMEDRVPKIGLWGIGLIELESDNFEAVSGILNPRVNQHGNALFIVIKALLQRN
ncbi:hypothetical protein F3Y22_tig00111502pilonHSYRG00014 [Hibiscus syriacus]|uniref:Uncharacterized protein n=1 Tax=Hibiscus syriacus TaxID=106335 RepID=A0A6A2XMW8_HIBSY|nr:hypothetical protein F3Y22_tig00111502pilonHSYRG00014 [Hibiscus syriacus]